jgi:hypothetical protein
LLDVPEIYESQVRQQVEEGNHGKIVAIDIETGIFELAEDICQQPTVYLRGTLMLSLGLSALDIVQFIGLAHGA